MNLYHGTILEYANNIIRNGIDVKYDEAKRGSDFGIGFYTTNFMPLAIRTAKIKSAFHQDDDINITPVVLVLKYDLSCGRNYNVKTYNTYGDDWKKFVCANRYKEVIDRNDNIDSNIDLKYDLVIGAIADSSMSYISNILKKNKYVLNTDIMRKISPYKIDNHIPIQYSFHNQNLASCIKVITYDIIPSGRS